MKQFLAAFLAVILAANPVFAANANVQADDSTGALWRPQSFSKFLVPSQAGNAGKYLTTNGTATSWATVAGGNGTGNVTGASLTANSIVTGNGTTAIKVSGVTIDASDNIVTTGNITANTVTANISATTGSVTTLNATNIGGATANGQLFIGNNTTGNFTKQSVSGDITLAASGAATIATGAVTNAKLANSTVTLGNTTLTLGGTTTTVTGLTSVSSGNFISANDSQINGLRIGRGVAGDSESVSIGLAAMNQSGAGVWNTAIGASSLKYNGSGGSNTAVGAFAITSAFSNNITGSSNTAVGAFSAYNLYAGAGNTGIGKDALNLVASGNYNTAVGMSAGGQTTGSSGTYLGAYAGLYDTTSNQVYIDSLDRTDLSGGRTKSLIWGTTNATVSSQQLTINAGTITLNGTLSGATISHASNTITGQPDVWVIPIGDETTAITTGTAKVTFRAPYAATVTAVRATLTTASSSGLPTFDINEGGTSILSTKLTIDASEKTSTTAATAAVISDTSLANDAEITIDVDTAGTGAAGAKIYLFVTR